jgi:predicted DCC family thiol-disulfide oxidoreductase YuxK
MAGEAGMARVQVYYDGDCPVCSREMDRCRVRPGAEAIDFVDINRDMTALEADGVSYEAALARLYVRDGRGRLHKGIAAYAVLFEMLPRYRWLARLVRLPGVRPALDGLYGIWAGLRFRTPSRPPARR